MSELTKAEIARINGAKSHGPVTPEGKSRSSMNALKHGLTAKTVCLANESQDAFQKLSQSLVEIWEPKNEVEDELVEEMAIAKWLQRRYWGVQTATIDLEMAAQAPEFARKYEEAGEMVRQAEAINGINAKSNTMSLLSRYDSSLSRQYYRAQNQLIKIREKNVFPPPAEPVLRNEPTPDPKSNTPNAPPADDPATTNEQRATSNAVRTTTNALHEQSDPPPAT